jgi:hypothetical protein
MPLGVAKAVVRESDSWNGLQRAVAGARIPTRVSLPTRSRPSARGMDSRLSAP